MNLELLLFQWKLMLKLLKQIDFDILGPTCEVQTGFYSGWIPNCCITLSWCPEPWTGVAAGDRWERLLNTLQPHVCPDTHMAPSHLAFTFLHNPANMWLHEVERPRWDMSESDRLDWMVWSSQVSYGSSVWNRYREQGGGGEGLLWVRSTLLIGFNCVRCLLTAKNCGHRDPV